MYIEINNIYNIGTMKQLKLLFGICLFTSVGFGQPNNFPATGNASIGLSNSSGANLHMHGTTDYVITVPSYYDINGNYYPGYSTNFGKTTRLLMTNTTCGSTDTDGTEIRMSGNDFTVDNLENEDIKLSTGGSVLTLSGSTGRMWSGPSPSTSTDYGQFNLRSNDNGIYFRSTTAGKYGVSLRMANDADHAIRVFNSTGADLNFAVTSGGLVYARKYTTTLGNIPDYVFKPSYNLMPLPELRDYIKTNQHLPNIPSAAEYEKTGVDLGEMNRLLLEKVEELTLYILELEERVNDLEEDK